MNIGINLANLPTLANAAAIQQQQLLQNQQQSLQSQPQSQLQTQQLQSQNTSQQSQSQIQLQQNQTLSQPLQQLTSSSSSMITNPINVTNSIPINIPSYPIVPSNNFIQNLAIPNNTPFNGKGISVLSPTSIISLSNVPSTFPNNKDSILANNSQFNMNKVISPVKPKGNKRSPSISNNPSPNAFPNGSPNVSPNASPNGSPNASPNVSRNASPKKLVRRSYSMTPLGSAAMSPSASPSKKPSEICEMTIKVLSTPCSIAYQSVLNIQNIIDEIITETAFETLHDINKYTDFISKPATIYTDIYGNTPWFPNSNDPAISFPCDICSRQTTAIKYASHLEKCMGKNVRTSSRVQTQKHNLKEKEKHDMAITVKPEYASNSNSVNDATDRKKRKLSTENNNPNLEDELFSQLQSDPTLLEQLESMLASEYTSPNSLGLQLSAYNSLSNTLKSPTNLKSPLNGNFKFKFDTKSSTDINNIFSSPAHQN